MRLRSLLRALLPFSAWLAFPSGVMALENAMLWTEEVQTRYGELQVINYKYPLFESHPGQLKLNGHVVFEAPNVLSIKKAPVFRLSDTDAVIMEVSQGGSGCPSAWRILTIQSRGKVILSQEIADCSNPTIDVKEMDDSLLLSPEFCARDYGKPFWTGTCWHEIWRFRHGQLAKFRETPKQSITPDTPSPGKAARESKRL